MNLLPMVTPPPLILDRNPIWHGKEVVGRQVFPDTIFYESYTASGAMALDLTLGKIDMAIGPSPPDFTGFLVGKPGITRQSVADGLAHFVFFNRITRADGMKQVDARRRAALDVSIQILAAKIGS